VSDPSRRRIVALAAAVLALVAAGVALVLWHLPGEAPPPSRYPEPAKEPARADAADGPARPAVVFVVLDMLRADRLSLCGYGRPTTPSLVALCERGAAATCRAYAPGTWTLPSHASYMTGEEVPVHGADCLADPAGAESVSLWGDPVRPLGDGLPTLAERMRRDGYETVLVSGNPIVSEGAATGLARGFDVVRESRLFGDHYGERLVASVRSALDEAATSGRPLFLFVNVCDAHHPWDPIPEGVGWAPPRPGLDNRPRLPENPYPRFFRGQMGDDEKERFLEAASDSYDWAVFRADRTFGRVLEVLEERGVLAGDFRLVVTSDHGEFLGEHDLLSHGIFVREPDTRVPLLYFEREAGERRGPTGFTEPISALVAHDLALDGALPEEPRPVRAVGYPDGLMSRLFGGRLDATTAALWIGSEKLYYENGSWSLHDLTSDPGEVSPSPLPADHPSREAFERFVARALETGRRKSSATPEMIEALRRLGYVR